MQLTMVCLHIFCRFNFHIFFFESVITVYKNAEMHFLCSHLNKINLNEIILDGSFFSELVFLKCLRNIVKNLADLHSRKLSFNGCFSLQTMKKVS